MKRAEVRKDRVNDTRKERKGNIWLYVHRNH